MVVPETWSPLLRLGLHNCTNCRSGRHFAQMRKISVEGFQSVVRRWRYSEACVVEVERLFLKHGTGHLSRKFGALGESS